MKNTSGTNYNVQCNQYLFELPIPYWIFNFKNTNSLLLKYVLFVDKKFGKNASHRASKDII